MSCDDLIARKLTYGVIEGQAGRRLDCALEFLQQQGICFKFSLKLDQRAFSR